MYWYGTPHPTTGVNLATCIWESRAHARAANGRPHHVKAMRLAAAAYEMYALEVRATAILGGDADANDAAEVHAPKGRG
jgi:hypothetical protein